MNDKISKIALDGAEQRMSRRTLIEGAATLAVAAELGNIAFSNASDAEEMSTMTETNDAFFGPPYIDVDEWADTPFRHRYVHGGFKDTDARFAFFFPESNYYQGRFLSLIYGGTEGRAYPAEMLNRTLQSAMSLGAYMVQSNSGYIGAAPGPSDPTIAAYRAAAQCARYARELATKMYGTRPHHGYIYGGSAGGLRTIYAMENVRDVWDGALPFVCGEISTMVNREVPPMAVAGMLGPKLPGVIDALEPGGGDPFAGLTNVERQSLSKVFSEGMQRSCFFQFGRPSVETTLSPPGLMATVIADPSYVDDFWKVPGYAGADGEYAARLVDQTVTVTQILTGAELAAGGLGSPAVFTMITPQGLNSHIGVKGDVPLASNTEYAILSIKSGAAAGKELSCEGTFNGVVVAGGPALAQGAKLAVGDKITIDNRRWLAVCNYHRYAAQRADKRKAPAGVPFGGVPMTGKIHGKAILLNAVDDGLAGIPPGPDYFKLVRQQFGEKTDDIFRHWWIDHTGHSSNSAPPGPRPVTASRLINSGGHISQALHDLVDWVEKGIAPPATTRYRIVEGQLELPATAGERNGLQPVVHATANGGVKADTRVGNDVAFVVTVEAPPGGGTIRKVEWDFDGSGAFAHAHDGVDGTSTSLRLTLNHRFDAPGTYFPSVRVAASRAADDGPVSLALENLDRVRVVVT